MITRFTTENYLLRNVTSVFKIEFMKKNFHVCIVFQEHSYCINRDIPVLERSKIVFG